MLQIHAGVNIHQYTVHDLLQLWCMCFRPKPYMWFCLIYHISY